MQRKVIVFAAQKSLTIVGNLKELVTLFEKPRGRGPGRGKDSSLKTAPSFLIMKTT